MQRAIANSYDASINSFKKYAALDYRLAVKLFSSNPPLSHIQAEELLTTTKDNLCDHYEVYKAYLKYYSTNGSPETVIQKFYQYKDAALRHSRLPDLHAIVVHALHDSGDMAGMAQVASELRALDWVSMTSAETESLLLYFSKTDIAQCESWWTYLKNTRELQLQNSTYNALVAAFAHAQNNCAFHVLAHMDSIGVSPDEETYASILQMTDTSKHSRTLDQLMNKFHNVDSCSAMLTQCVRTENLARAQELRILRGTSSFSVASLNLLLAALAKQGNVTRAAALLRDMTQRDAVTFEIAANMYARAGDVRACRELVKEMETTNIPITRGVLLALMDVYVAHGDCEACEGIFETLRTANDGTSIVYDKMITLYGNSGDLQKARDTWKLMISQGISPSTNSYNLIIAAHAKHGGAADCLRLFQDMQASQLAPNMGTFAGILTANVLQRNFRSSLQYFEEMTKVLPVTNAVGAIFEYCNLKSSLKNEGLQAASQ